MLKYRKILYIISGSLVFASLLAFAVWGLDPSIDFTGGSILEVEYINERPDIATIRTDINALGFGSALVQPIDEKGLLVRLRELSGSEHQALLNTISGGVTPDESLVEKRFDSIGPVIGKELTRKAWTSIFMVITMIVLFIAWAFRKVSRPVSSWKYGVVAIVALIHDVVIPVGVFSFLGHFYHIEVDILFVTALLTILGFSVHDTIVVFDRIRENLKRGFGKSFEDTIDISLKQVRGRSIKTSFTILLVLLALFFFGGQTTQYFTLTMILGITFGTYSSLFLASPLLVTWQKWQEKKN